MDTLDHNSTRAPEEASVADSHIGHPNHGADDEPKDATSLMSLPVELRLMVYEYAICETRRRLPIPGVDIYFCDVRSTLLQVSRSVRKEMLPSLKRRRHRLAPCLSIYLPDHLPRTDMSNPLFLLPHIIRMLAEERCTDRRQNGPDVAISERLPDVGLNGFARRLGSLVWRTNYTAVNHISSRPHFKTFFYRSARQLRSTRTIVIRLLLNRESAKANMETNIHDHYWSHLYRSTHDRFPSNLKLRTVFVVLPDDAQYLRRLLEEPEMLPPALTGQVRSVEVSRSGLNPAVD